MTIDLLLYLPAQEISKYLSSVTHSIQNSVCESPIFTEFVLEIYCSLLTVHYLLVITHYLLLKFQAANQETENILYGQ